MNNYFPVIWLGLYSCDENKEKSEKLVCKLKPFLGIRVKSDHATNESKKQSDFLKVPSR